MSLRCDLVGSLSQLGASVFSFLGEEEEESDDEFCNRTTAPLPKWDEVLAGNRAMGYVGAALPATAAGSGEFWLERTERVL
jgi:hypothetical protein